MTTRPDILPLYRPRNPFTHKGNYGHALMIAGSREKMGAAILAARACLRSGAGLLTCCVPETSFATINMAAPEAMTLSNDLKQFTELERYAAIGIGPGLGTDATIKRTIIAVLASANKGLVIDADGLNCLAALPGSMDNLPVDCILTPHPREFERLFGKTGDGFKRIELAIELSNKLPLIIVLKDHHSLIACKGRGYFNNTGNAGMAKGGSGDVLTGLLTALLAQGYQALDAAIMGVYLHGLAADIAIQQHSAESLLPTDIIEGLGSAFRSLVKHE